MNTPIEQNTVSHFSRRWNYALTLLQQNIDFTARNITLLYLVFGFLALYLSDVVFVWLFDEPFLSQVQALKGGGEVLLTGGLVYAMTAISRSQIQQTNAQLEERNQELEVLHRVMRHNLRNNLNVLMGYAEYVRSEVQSGDLKDACDCIVDSSETIHNYSEQAVQIQNLSDSDIPVIMELEERLPSLIENHEFVTENVTVDVNIPENTAVWVLPQFEDALRELVSNAIQHNHQDDPVVEITADPTVGPAHICELRVIDNGPGIPEVELSALKKGEADPVHHLSGLGLWFVYWTVQRSGGGIRFEGTPEGGTAVRMELLSDDSLVSRTTGITMRQFSVGEERALTFG
jgi:signal transduction histidine kinase